MPEQEDNQTSTGPQGPYKPFVPESDDSERPLAEGTADEPDDTLLQEASSDVGEEIGVPPPEDFQPKRSGKKFGKVLLILILLAGIAGGAYYYFMVYKKAEPAAAPAPQVEAPAANTFTPENVAYAFREKESDPFMLYLRPVAGGDRVEAGELGEDTYPTSDVFGQNVVIVFDNKLQISTDAGKSYTQIMEPGAGQEITSAAFNTDGTKIGVAIYNSEDSKATVSSMSLDGQNTAEVFTSKDHQYIELLGWNETSVIFDGFAGGHAQWTGSYKYMVESKKYTSLVKLEDGMQISNVALSDDMSNLVYSYGKIDTAAEGPGAAPLAPHTVSVVDVASVESKEIATVGKAGEKAKNGTPLQRDTIVGFIENSTNPYIVNGKSLVTAGGDEPRALYEATDTIVDVEFVSDKTIILASGTVNDFTLTNFNITSDETSTILEGDAETVLFGITTK